MRAFLTRWLGWLSVPTPATKPDPFNAPAAVDGAIPPGIYLFEPGATLTGHEPLSFYAEHRVGDAKRAILGYAVYP